MTGGASVPFLDLPGVNNGLREELDLAWKTVLNHGGYIGGPEVERFEREFATYCGTQACVGVANGTDALELILGGLGIGRGDEVIVPANTFIATAVAVVDRQPGSAASARAMAARVLAGRPERARALAGR